jgi:membrane protease subunit (stomatin/prohibitin family)
MGGVRGYAVMPYWPNCGQGTQGGMKFCPNCGQDQAVLIPHDQRK